MSKQEKNFVRLVPGEPVPQFGGMTPEQFGELAGELEKLLLEMFGSADGAMTMYGHLSARLFLDVEEAAGPDAMQKAMAASQAALHDEIIGQRKLRASLKAQQKAAHNHDAGLN